MYYYTATTDLIFSVFLQIDENEIQCRLILSLKESSPPFSEPLIKPHVSEDAVYADYNINIEVMTPSEVKETE
jgi:hypothetical protein